MESKTKWATVFGVFGVQVPLIQASLDNHDLYD